MANTGKQINPKVIQIFTSGVNSGSEVSSSFNTTFNEGSGYTSASLCDETYVYKEDNLGNCPLPDVCAVPTLSEVRYVSCNNNSLMEMTAIVRRNNAVAEEVRIQMSTSPTFSSNVGTYVILAADQPQYGDTYRFNPQDYLPNPPINNTTDIYVRASIKCNAGNISPYTSIKKAEGCVDKTIPPEFRFISETRDTCKTCIGFEIITKSPGDIFLEVTKSGRGLYDDRGCNHPNLITQNTRTRVYRTTTYSTGIAGINSFSAARFRTTITVKLIFNDSVVDTYILRRDHIDQQC